MRHLQVWQNLCSACDQSMYWLTLKYFPALVTLEGWVPLIPLHFNLSIDFLVLCMPTCRLSSTAANFFPCCQFFSTFLDTFLPHNCWFTLTVQYSHECHHNFPKLGAWYVPQTWLVHVAQSRVMCHFFSCFCQHWCCARHKTSKSLQQAAGEEQLFW